MGVYRAITAADQWTDPFVTRATGEARGSESPAGGAHGGDSSFHLSVWGTFSATVTVQIRPWLKPGTQTRSDDGDWRDVTPGGAYTAPTEKNGNLKGIWELRAGVKAGAYTSGTANVAIQAGAGHPDAGPIFGSDTSGGETTITNDPIGIKGTNGTSIASPANPLDVSSKAKDTITGLPSDIYTVDLGSYNSLPVTPVDLAGTAATFQTETGYTPIAENLIAAKSVTATASGTTLIASPSVGSNAIRLWWYNLSADPANGAHVVAGLRFGIAGTDFYKAKLSQYGAATAHSFKSGRSYLQGAVGEGLYVNLDLSQTVYVNIDYEEVTP